MSEITIERKLASEWHGGQSSALYAFSSTGTVLPSLCDEIIDSYRSASKMKDRAALARFYAIVAPSVTIDTIDESTEYWHRHAVDYRGFPVRCRSNGKLKTWKTRPDEFRKPVKYGLKQCFYIDHNNAVDWIAAPF